VIDLLCSTFEIRGTVRDAARRAWRRVRDLRYHAQTQVKASMLRAFVEAGIAESDFAGSSGYGYDDAARAAYESLLARVFGAERVLARLSIVSGTHAIVTTLAACVAPGATLLSASGKPYDTLRNAICDAEHALAKTQGIGYREVALRGDGAPDLDGIERELKAGGVGAVFVQRSRGYAPRPSLTVAQIGSVVERVRACAPGTPVLVDNCYGELVEAREPTHVGADLVMGSLIKNLGGSLAPAGGYVAGRADLVARVASRLYAPGLGDALGPTLGFGRAFIQGLFFAPSVVEQTLRGLDFAAALFAELGYEVDPLPGIARTDIVQAIRLRGAPALIRFAEGLQKALPVNARFRPEPGAVPGYTDPVIMSSGSFVGGATIELSCDAPLRPPFEVYLQGGISAEHAYLGALCAARDVVEGATPEKRTGSACEHRRSSASAQIFPRGRRLSGDRHRPRGRAGPDRPRHRPERRRHAGRDGERASARPSRGAALPSSRARARAVDPRPGRALVLRCVAARIRPRTGLHPVRATRSGRDHRLHPRAAKAAVVGKGLRG